MPGVLPAQQLKLEQASSLIRLAVVLDVSVAEQFPGVLSAADRSHIGTSAESFQHNTRPP